ACSEVGEYCDGTFINRCCKRLDCKLKTRSSNSARMTIVRHLNEFFPQEELVLLQFYKNTKKRFESDSQPGVFPETTKDGRQNEEKGLGVKRKRGPEEA
ncbi:unnamed protein product, partial [Protopolystoma xenopodis]